MYYIARTADMFISIRVLTLKSIISSIVHSDEIGKNSYSSTIFPFFLRDKFSSINVRLFNFIGKVFSLMGILESVGRLIFVPVYATIYERTLSTWAGSFYIFSFFVLSFAAVLFM